MKTRFAFFKCLALCLFTTLAHSQIADNDPWCPKGANWVYWSFSATSNIYYKFSYQKDSMIQSTAVKVLVVYKIEYYGIPGQLVRTSQEVGREFVYASNDSVYWFDKVNNRFSFIYPLRPAVGDYWIASNSRAYCPGDSSFPVSDTIFVTSATNYTLGNRVFKIYDTSRERNFYLGTIIENIGPGSCPFPEINPSKCYHPTTEYGSFYQNLVCYSDSIRGRITFENSSNECDSIVLDIRDEFHYQSNPFTMYPNPTNSSVFIKNSQNIPIKQIIVASTTGNIVFEDIFQNSEASIDVSYLMPGVYTIKITDYENHPHVLKILKR